MIEMFGWEATLAFFVSCGLSFAGGLLLGMSKQTNDEPKSWNTKTLDGQCSSVDLMFGACCVLGEAHDGPHSGFSGIIGKKVQWSDLEAP